MGAAEHYFGVLPPRRGAVWAQAVDGTARVYDLQALDIGGMKPNNENVRQIEVEVWMQVDGANDVYFAFSSTSATDLDDATKQAATTAPAAYANTYGAVLKSGNAPVRFRLSRQIDKFLILKCAAAGTGTLRVWAASGSY